MIAWVAVASRVGAQAPPPPPGPDPAAVYNAAISAYEGGDYQKSIDSVKTLLSLASTASTDMTPAESAQLSTQLEAMYFTLGAAYFGLKDWPQATAALTDYLTRYPSGSKLAEGRFLLAQARFFAKDYQTAANAFAALENVAAFREQALLFEGLSFKEAGEKAAAIVPLEKLYANGITSPMVARGAAQLVALYGEQNQADKAFKVLADLQAHIFQVENIVELNGIVLGQGDAFLENGKGKEALACYRAVRTRNEVISLQHERIARLQHQVDASKLAIRAEPRQASRYLMTAKRLQEAVVETQGAVQALEQAPDFRPQLLYRIGRAFALLNRPWEALVAYHDTLAATKDEKEREPALYAAISAYVEVDRPVLARKLCEEYLKDFPQGPNASPVGYMLGATALQENDPKMAESLFGRILAEQPDSSMAAEMLFQLANAKFAQGKLDEAKADYARYQERFPDGTHKEECVYRFALGSLFSGHYEEALKQLDDYLQRGGTQFASDAKYRRLVCLYAAQRYEDVAGGCQTWLAEHPAEPQQGDVLALLGDAQTALGKSDLALQSYQRSYKTAATDEVLNYSIQEAAKILQKRGDWTGIGTMYADFVRDHPQHPSVALAMTWIARAKTKEGKLDEAKHFMADYIKKSIDDPSQGAVENLLDQLAALCVRRRPAPVDLPVAPASASTPATDGTPVMAAASATPTATPASSTAELDELLGGVAQDQHPTAQARILYAKAQLARLRRHADEANGLLQEIGTRFKPADLSAILLGQSGDALLAAGKPDDAAPLYRALLENFSKSDVIDFAYWGLGEIALRKGEYAEALRSFEDGTFKIVPALKLKDLTVGRAQAQLGLGHDDEAKKLFEQIVSTKEWRGEATAISLCGLAEIEAKRGRWKEANELYQRVFIAYARFAPWVAKAYLGSAESLEKLGKPQEAVRIYQEMIDNRKIAGLPEVDRARERLKALGAS